MTNTKKDIICLGDIKLVTGSPLSQGAKKARRRTVCLGDLGSLAGSVLSQGGKQPRRSSKETRKIASRVLRDFFRKP